MKIEKSKLKSSEIKEKRLSLLKEQNNKCLILKENLDENKAVLDHVHKEHKSFYTNTSFIRGVIHSDINVLLGKIENQWNRSSKEIKQNYKLSNILRNIADYIEYFEKNPTNIIHPREYKYPKIMKSKYNKLKKIYEENSNKKFPPFPKSGKLTKPLKEIANQFNFNLYKDEED